jgi:hypothetical protein
MNEFSDAIEEITLALVDLQEVKECISKSLEGSFL